MYRKGTSNNINESIIPHETPTRVCKTPRIVINKLNIPLDSVVIVKGDSVIFPVESSKNTPSKLDKIIDITTSDDDFSNDEEFQKLVIKRFQSTKNCETVDETSKQTSSSLEQQSVKKYYTYGPKSRRKLLPHPKTIRKKIKGASNVEEMKSSKELRSSEKLTECRFSENNGNSQIDGETELNTIMNVESESDESNIVSKSFSVLSNEASNIKSSVNSNKSGPNINKTTIDKDVAEIIAILEDSPVERDENEKYEISENKTESDATQTEFTPSRTSQRIKNKKVKFSALRLLAGAEIPSTKKKVPTDPVKKASTPKKSVGKTKGNSTADINANSDLSSILGEELSNTNDIMKEKNNIIEDKEDLLDKPKLNKNTPHKPVKQYTNVKKMLASKNKSNENSEKVSISSPPKEKGTKDLNSTNNETKNNLNESKTNGSEEIVQNSSLVKENVTNKEVNNKIRVELQGTTQKKIVNITISPKKSSKTEGLQKDSIKEKKEIELGPDIIIRKIKSKKQDNDKIVPSIDEKEKTIPKNDNVQSSKSSENSVNLVSDVFQNNLIVKNLIYPEKSIKTGIKPIQEVEVPPMIKKFIEETTKKKQPNENNDSVNNQKTGVTNKNKKKLEFNKRKHRNKQKIRRVHSSDDDYSDREYDVNDDSTEPDSSDVQIINSTLEDEDDVVITHGDDSLMKKSINDKKNSREEIFGSNVIRVGGKKTAKVLPLRHPPKSDITKKTFNDKFNEKDKEYMAKQSKTIPRLSSPSELSVLGGKRNYKNAFEKYFICTETIYEHNDSMESDSSSDDEDYLFSHFVDLRRRNRNNKEVIDETTVPEFSEEIEIVDNNLETNSEQVNNLNIENTSIISELGDVIKGIIATDLPKWTCHTVPENSVICLLLLERESNGTYDVRKSIEIDANFNANVYVNKKLIDEYCGVYDSYEAIKNLIYQVELL